MTEPHNEKDVRVDRDATRQELGETVEALAHKLDVPSRVHETVDDKLDKATDKLVDAVPDPAAGKVRHGADAVRANPAPVFAALLALLVAIRLVARRKARHRNA
ncbi:DUF3618 domain-containing protein [Amycolatopsis sp. CA-230715]|uniref:DUF3618 domain-containing protein n=1 Tax=Amycolatopsis sp. CA-230715 TaxID=2745196 RepID=UPI001C02CF9B|nr:DUF3618 domain-containing protein [Amycolatopsis sp. CA-230715]QWF86043.1 hypothetical protein HUW46_09524 [Amycolatopsis sp. CA-230715]